MSLEEIYNTKLNKLEEIKKSGTNPYPSKSPRTHTINEVILNFEKIKKNSEEIIICGRVIAKREHGGSTFIKLEDGTSRIQAYFKKDAIGEEKYKFFLANIDVGDFISTKGILFTTKKGEMTVEAEKYEILSKALLPLPEKWHGLQDIEERYRKRYLDLIMNKGVKAKFETRSRIIKSARNILDQGGFTEVETPILQTIPGGALAKPFKTHLNALNIDLYLRIAPELFLKRLLVGGFEKVYEIGRCFRNEGIDPTHNPDFTMLEFYAAYWDYKQMMDFVKKFFQSLLNDVFGRENIEYEGNQINFGDNWEVLEFEKLLKRDIGLDYFRSTRSDLLNKANELGVKMQNPKILGKGKIADEIYKKICRPKIVQPTFMINHPVEISPLAKNITNDPQKVERFQLIVGGMEIVNAFSELNDPIEQKKRFGEQEKEAEKGDDELHRMDYDFIDALSYGMPPAAGAGIGIDRIVSLFTDSRNVREVILFPTMKPNKNSKALKKKEET